MIFGKYVGERKQNVGTLKGKYAKISRKWAKRIAQIITVHYNSGLPYTIYHQGFQNEVSSVNLLHVAKVSLLQLVYGTVLYENMRHKTLCIR